MLSILANLSTILSIALVAQAYQVNGQLQSDQSQDVVKLNLPGNLMGKLSNNSEQANVWVLMPSSVNMTDISEDEYNLFKLDTRSLVYGSQRFGDDSIDSLFDQDNQEDNSGHLNNGKHRGARKMNFFKNVLNKPRVSPLYLVNGTVCRFVNSQPICTTLFTTGLIRPQNQPGTNQQQLGGLFGQQQQQQQGQQQQSNNNLPQGGRQAPFGSQGGLNQQQFNPQFQQQGGQNNQQFNPQQGGNFQQPFRAAAINDDETADINVEASQNNVNATSANSTKVVRGQQSASNNKMQTMTRPVNLVVSRRPLNLLSFGRPFRQYQMGSRRVGFTAVR